MATGTVFDPKNQNDYEKSKMQVNNIGKIATCAAGGTVNIDWTSADDHLLMGFSVGCKGQKFGDKIDIEIHHPQAGLVLKPVDDWMVADDQQMQVNENSTYPAKIPAGLIIRVVYQSTGVTDVEVFVNFKMHKVLV